jgi:hypothetical protein
MLIATNVLLPDGREALLWPTTPRFADADRLISEERRLVDAKSENRGIFRVWSVPATNVPLAELAKQPFTAAAVAARSGFDLTDNFDTL